MSFHNELKYYREEILGLSQEEVIKRLHMSQPTLSLYENGKRQITVELLQLIPTGLFHTRGLFDENAFWRGNNY